MVQKNFRAEDFKNAKASKASGGDDVHADSSTVVDSIQETVSVDEDGAVHVERKDDNPGVLNEDAEAEKVAPKKRAKKTEE